MADCPCSLRAAPNEGSAARSALTAAESPARTAPKNSWTLLIKSLLQEMRESESLTLVPAERDAAAAKDNSAQSRLKFPLQKRISIPLALRESLEKQEGGGHHAETHPRLAGRCDCGIGRRKLDRGTDRKSTRLNSSHLVISYAVFCLKKKKTHDYA